MKPMPPLPTMNGYHQTEGVDAVLGRFFRAQMPDPWPQLEVPLSMPTPRNRFNWVRAGGRLALAASILFAVVGYIALGGMFPQDNPTSGLDAALQEIGHNPISTTVKTKRGIPALMNENVIPGGAGQRDITIINVQELPGGKK